jgi:TolB protein
VRLVSEEVFIPLPQCRVRTRFALSRQTGKILFVSDRLHRGKMDIFTMGTDGSKQIALTRTPGDEFDPVLSPDGSQIAFAAATRSKDRASEICTMRADGSHRRRLTQMGTWVFAPAWSPDGQRIAFTAIRPADGSADVLEIHVVNRDGRNRKRLGKGMMPAWSPDGRRILYTVVPDVLHNTDSETWGTLHIMDADGSNPRRLTDAEAFMGVWSPDGRRIAYIGAGIDESNHLDHADLYVMNADGSDPKPITRTRDVEYGPQWSADGQRLFFTRFRADEEDEAFGPRGEICVIDADGRKLRQLTSSNASAVLNGAGFLDWLVNLVAAALSQMSVIPAGIQWPVETTWLSRSRSGWSSERSSDRRHCCVRRGPTGTWPEYPGSGRHSSDGRRPINQRWDAFCLSPPHRGVGSFLRTHQAFRRSAALG